MNRTDKLIEIVSDLARATWYAPPGLDTRAGLKQKGVKVPKDAKPDAIKNSYPTGYFFLFRVKNWLTETEK